jgi:hypothetical protein
MSNLFSARTLILVGTLMTAFGLVLYSQMGTIVELRVALWVLNAAAMTSFAMTALGSLITLTGGVYWARRAPSVQVITSGASAGLAVVLVAYFVDINVHGPTAMLIFVEIVGAFGSVVMLSIAAARLLDRQGPV